MIDLHAHVLAALDDGPKTLAEALGQLAAASEAGISVIAATPHVSPRYPTTPEAMERELARTTAELDRRGLPIQVVSGGEVDVSMVDRLSPEDLRRFSLGARGRYMLVELPFEGPSAAEMATLRRLAGHGLRPVIAHPERQSDIQARPGRAGSLVESGCMLQVTASSLLGLHGRAAATSARTLLEHGLVHLLASDMHGSTIRRATLADARPALGSDRLARWLTEDAPRAILAGNDLPPRPRPARKRLLGFL